MVVVINLTPHPIQSESEGTLMHTVIIIILSLRRWSILNYQLVLFKL